MTRILNFIYSIGAAIVIFGAWQKIEHRQSADLFLTIGLLCECCIFCLYGFRELTVKEQSTQVAGGAADNGELIKSVNNLTQLIKRIFNQ